MFWEIIGSPQDESVRLADKMAMPQVPMPQYLACVFRALAVYLKHVRSHYLR
jgi:hypothetical protein